MHEWTQAQRDAILARGGALLVSAAAGSGKTAVLVERVVSLICDEQDPVDADKLLIVTFTNAAAAEMKQRIGARLGELLRERPLDVRLQRQQALLSRASIGTVHSFCLELIRQNFQHLPVSPDFTLADEGELTVLRQACAQELIERHYESADRGGFVSLVELLSAGRDDSKTADTILRIYDFARSHPFYERWLENMAALYRTDVPAAETIWGQALLGDARECLEYCIASLGEALALARSDEAVHTAYGPALESDLARARACLESVAAAHWDEAVAALRGFDFVSLGRLRGADALKVRIKAIRERCKKRIRELGERTLNATDEEFRQDMADLAPKIRLLFSLVLEFDRCFTAAKAERKRLDFADLEHYALRLLVEPAEGGAVRTERAERLAERYRYVLVDEYQDTNEVQDLIFTSVSDSQRNLFFVGDAKQSIYSFRLAMPEIFLGKKERFFPYSTGQYPAGINLDTNFRSRGTVTGAVNFLFERLMSRSVGDIDYGGEKLVCGARYPDYDRAQPELHLLCLADYDGPLAAAELEARHVARTIEGMLREGYLVGDREGMRPARPGDFCVLLRSTKQRAPVYVKALSRLGIPAWGQNAGGFLQAREVGMVLSLLEALDNPLLDVPLLAAMLSPLFGFSDDEIAAVRLRERDAPFYTALRLRAQEGDRRAGDFLEVFTRLRTQAALLPADRLLLEVYEATDALVVAQAMPLGENRRANLLQLVEYASDYHRRGYRKLGGFLDFLARLRERGGDLAPAGTMGENADAVRVMSVHRSKGLEFPIVILADNARQFNRTDLYQTTQLHSRYGFACVRREAATLKQYPTVPMQAIRRASERSMLSEELRILYVALTRAREKLILSAVQKSDPASRLAALQSPLVGGKLPPQLVGEARSVLDWLLAAMLHHPDGAALREAAGCADLPVLGDGTAWKIELLKPSGEEEQARPERTVAHTAPPDPDLLRLLGERAAFVYPYRAHTAIPARLAVSAAVKGPAAARHRFAARPKFLGGAELSAAERGNAHHKFMQFADYRRARDDLETEIARMLEKKYLTGAECACLDRKKLRGFFHSPLAGRMFAGEKIWRELKFMRECGKDMLGGIIQGMDDEAAVRLQGVADCVFVENGKAVVVDYKTDAVTSAQQLIDRYRGQLSLYRQLLSGALPVPVGECILYSFALGQAIVLPDTPVYK